MGLEIGESVLVFQMLTAVSFGIDERMNLHGRWVTFLCVAWGVWVMMEGLRPEFFQVSRTQEVTPVPMVWLIREMGKRGHVATKGSRWQTDPCLPRRSRLGPIKPSSLEQWGTQELISTFSLLGLNSTRPLEVKDNIVLTIPCLVPSQLKCPLMWARGHTGHFLTLATWTSGISSWSVTIESSNWNVFPIKVGPVSGWSLLCLPSSN